MLIRLADKLQRGSIVDGVGIRAVIWTQGCPHNCFKCHNPLTHDYDGGFLVDVEDLKKELSFIDIEEGVTFSGGDPFVQPEQCAELAKFCHEQKLNVWCYTGYTWEELISKSNDNSHIMNFLKEIDVLIDGRFVFKLKSLEAKFRGSKNQRVIDVKKSLKRKEIITIDIDHAKKSRKQKEDVYI